MLFRLFLFILITYVTTEKVIVGYLPEYRFYIDVEKASEYLTDLILFSVAPTHDGDLDTSFLQPNMFERVQKIKSTHKIRVLICIGGAGRSNGFESATKDRQKRQKLISSLLTLVQKYSFDGVDFDWEAPTSHIQFNNYIKLLSEFREHINKINTEKNLNLLSTVALHPGQSLGKEGNKVVDRVHLMTYDNFESKNGHSTLIDGKNAVHALISTNLPKEKIVLGIPAYGRSLQNPGKVLTYSEIIDKHNPEPKIDLINNDISFNSVKVVKQKVEWVKQEGILGVMIWEIGQDKIDHQNSLLNAIHKKMNGDNSNDDDDDSNKNEKKNGTLNFVGAFLMVVIGRGLISYFLKRRRFLKQQQQQNKTNETKKEGNNLVQGNKKEEPKKQQQQKQKQYDNKKKK